MDGTEIGTVQVLGRAQPISEAANESLTWLGLLAGTSMLVGGSALAFALFRGLGPLQELAATAQRTGELEQLSERVREPERADEVGVLAREFNRMLERLERSARARTEFLATVSHELRTPVTIARGHVETLERSAADDPSRIRVTAGVIREELTHVGRLVDDLLALNRAQLDDFVVPADVDLERLFADLELRLDGLGLSAVELQPAPELTVRADGARLQQALLNLPTTARASTRTSPAGCWSHLSRGRGSVGTTRAAWGWPSSTPSRGHTGVRCGSTPRRTAPRSGWCSRWPVRADNVVSHNDALAAGTTVTLDALADRTLISLPRGPACGPVSTTERPISPAARALIHHTPRVLANPPADR